MQNVLAHQLPRALAGTPNKERVGTSLLVSQATSNTLFQIIDEIRHSISAIKTLPPDVQEIARQVYFEAIRYSFIATTVIASVAFIAALFARGRDLNRD